MKKPKKTPPKPQQTRQSRPLPRQRKVGGNGEEEQLKQLKKAVGLYSTGDTAAKATILAHYISYSKLFECRWTSFFDHDPVIQKKLKNDFNRSLMAFVRWIEAPGNQVPMYSPTRAEKSGNPTVKKFIGFTATGAFAAKSIIMGYYRPYGQLIEEVIHGCFDNDTAIQSRLRKCDNNLYRLLRSF
jgi:hypothetical protein